MSLYSESGIEGAKMPDENLDWSQFDGHRDPNELRIEKKEIEVEADRDEWSIQDILQIIKKDKQIIMKVLVVLFIIGVVFICVSAIMLENGYNDLVFQLNSCKAALSSQPSFL